MIKKLMSKIFTLMMLSLSIIVIGIIILFATLNCNNAIHSSRENIDRMTRMRDKPDFQQSTMKPEIQEYINQENEKVNTHIKTVIIFSCATSGLALIVIYAISKKVSGIIVKPVEATLERQKQFISDASHELKTPLAVIEANADVLENEVGNNKWLTYIQKEQKDKIFERFYRVDKTRNRNEKRYGLGLAIAKSTVLKYKGKIEVNCKDGITCFRVVLPIKD